MKNMCVLFCHLSLKLFYLVFCDVGDILEVIIPGEFDEVGSAVYACLLDVSHACEHEVVRLPSCGTPHVTVLAGIAVYYEAYLPEL